MVARKKLTTNDALGFINAVKTKYQHNREVYDGFLEIMKDFKSQKVATIDVLVKVKELFKGQHELLLGFNTFLPMGFKITLEDDQPKSAHFDEKSAHFDKAYNFVNKVKTTLQNDHAFNSFSEVLKTCKTESKSIAQLCHEVAIIFRGHQDLFQEFLHFLPGCE